MHGKIQGHASAAGQPDDVCLLNVEQIKERLQILPITVLHSRWIIRLSESPGIIGDDTELFSEHRHLRPPHAAIKGEAVNKDDWSAVTDVFNVQIRCADVAACLHGLTSLN